MAEEIPNLSLSTFQGKFQEMPEDLSSVLLSASYCSRRAKRILVYEKHTSTSYLLRKIDVKSAGSNASFGRCSVSEDMKKPNNGPKNTVNARTDPKNKFLLTSSNNTLDDDEDKKTKIELTKTPGHMMRAQTHLLLLAPFGFTKSSSMKKLKDSILLVEATHAGIMGTITEEGEYVPGILQQAAGKYLIIDEIQNISSSARNAMLSVLEEQQCSRQLAYKIRTPVKENNTEKEYEKSLWSIDAQNNMFVIKARFSAACSGLSSMSNWLRKGDANSWAWYSRMVPLVNTGTVDDVYKLVTGELEYKLWKDIKPYTYQMYFPDYLKAAQLHKDLMNTMPYIDFFSTEKAGFLGRNLGDTTRLASFFAAVDGNCEITLDTFKLALSFSPLVMFNVIAGTLTKTEYRILTQLIFGREEKKIAEELNVTLDHVYKTKEKVAGMGIVKV